MGRHVRNGLILVLLVLSALVSTRLDRVSVQSAEGAARVNDGDTITIGTERLRLRGIDAPELDQTCSRAGLDYACGREARRQLEGLALGRSMRCQGWERDRYGRLLVECTVGSVNVNRRLVELGWAVAYGDYRDAEAAARRDQQGLWAGPFEQPRAWRQRAGLGYDAPHDWLQSLWIWVRQLSAGT